MYVHLQRDKHAQHHKHLLEFDYEKKLMMKERILKKHTPTGSAKFRSYRLLRMLPFDTPIPNFYPVFAKHHLLSQDSLIKIEDREKDSSVQQRIDDDLESVRQLLQLEDETTHFDILHEINNQFDAIENNSMLDSSVNSRSSLAQTVSSTRSFYISTLQQRPIEEYLYFFSDLHKNHYVHDHRPVQDLDIDYSLNTPIMKDVREVDLLTLHDQTFAGNHEESPSKRQH
jgi:hypothetical protein